MFTTPENILKMLSQKLRLLNFASVPLWYIIYVRGLIYCAALINSLYLTKVRRYEGTMVRLSCRIIHENMSDLSKLLCFHYLKNLIKMIIAVKLIEGTVLFHFGSHQPGETSIFCQNIIGDLNARSGSLF